MVDSSNSSLTSSQYASVPVDRKWFEGLYQCGLRKDFENFGFKLYDGDVMQEQYFKGITNEPLVQRKKLFKLLHSNAIVPKDSFSSNSAYSDGHISYQRKFENLRRGVCNGFASVNPSEYGSSILTYGPWFTFPHGDELMMGGGALIPTWNQVDVIKLWIFSTIADARTNRMIQVRSSTRKTTPEELQEFRDNTAKLLLNSVESGYACVIIQKPGQVLTFPPGHVHAVITAFASSDRSSNMCVMETFNVVEISKANSVKFHNNSSAASATDVNSVLHSTQDIPEPHEFKAEISYVDSFGHTRKFPLEFIEHADAHGAVDTLQNAPNAKFNRDNNYRAAICHVVADAFVSVLVILALVVIGLTGEANFLDPLVALIGAAVIFSWSFTLIRDTTLNLLDTIPDKGMVAALKCKLEGDGSVVNDLHVWRLGPGHLGAVISLVAFKEGSTKDYYLNKIKGFKALSHITMEIQCKENAV